MPTAFELADRFIDDLCHINPLLATSLGISGFDHLWPDEGMAGVEDRIDLVRSYLTLTEPERLSEDPRQALAARVAIGSAHESISGYEAGDHFRDLRHMASPFHQLGSVFDVMRKGTAGDWANIQRRLETIDEPYVGLMNRLDEGRSRGISVAERQVRSVIAQAELRSSDESALDVLADDARRGGFFDSGLEAALAHAKGQAARFASYLADSYLPDARAGDGVGEEIYARNSDRMLGLTIDPHEIYSWGWEEFHRLRSEMVRTGESIKAGAGILEVKDMLETDPAGLAKGTDELLEFVDRILVEAVEDLAGTHFDLPAEIRPLTTQTAPSGRPLGVYYIPPSEDLKRPGGVWYSIGDQTEFPLYQHVSTAYHEGFPGHHLQLATAMLRRDELSRIQRVATWYPGFGEGWAMYAEVLMGELGYLEDPRYYFGMLAKQMYRAARVVVDIGLHLGKTIDPSSPLHPGEPWSFETATEFMEIYGFRTAAQAEAEVLRYLGWPGQAISYKVGEREILAIREETMRRLGSSFDLTSFHSAVVNHGTMRLDLLRAVVKETLGHE